jgi:Casein kinase substrate phosphoprotein PP28
VRLRGQAHPCALTRADLGALFREAAEEKAKKERYMALHHAGKTDEAKRDLARLVRLIARDVEPLRVGWRLTSR